ncbi:hypothetical protein SLS56_012164 [Neofusicoccum ribis]|uniref:Oligopeptide transporter n=1 Tax=Neofusicoccum ribis TaxID=45134 RepID=A0ABR3S9L9_9PEZI
MSDDKSEGVVNVDSKPEHLLDKGPETTESEADRAEVLSAAGISLASEDADLPCLTLRMWVIGIGFCLLGSGLNTLYTFRYPSITLSQAAIQFLAFPLGRLWERVVPDWTIPIFGWKLDLNRGRFNHKENILIFIMANLSFFTRLSADVLTEQRVFYGVKCGWGFEIIITLATILFGFSLAGSQIAYISSPLIAPPWAIINLLASLVFWIYIISPALYYTNTWYSTYLPIQSNSVFDNMAETYNVSKVIDKSNGFQFDPAKYNSYSPVGIHFYDFG